MAVRRYKGNADGLGVQYEGSGWAESWRVGAYYWVSEKGSGRL